MTADEQRDAYRKKCKYMRNAAIIHNLEDGKRKKHDSINAAKRWVREYARFTTYRIH